MGKKDKTTGYQLSLFFPQFSKNFFPLSLCGIEFKVPYAQIFEKKKNKIYRMDPTFMA